MNLQITDTKLLAAYLATLAGQAQPKMPAKRLPELLQQLLSTTNYLTVAQLAPPSLLVPSSYSVIYASWTNCWLERPCR